MAVRELPFVLLDQFRPASHRIVEQIVPALPYRRSEPRQDIGDIVGIAGTILAERIAVLPVEKQERLILHPRPNG